MLRFLTAGESHGPALTVIIEGLPAGLDVTVDDVAAELARRRLGYGRGPRMALEQDELEFLGGVRHGRTLGSPVSVVIRNTEWWKWEEEMSPHPGDPKRRMTQPRPGHADLAGMQKYGFDDARNVLERASARETAARVTAGVFAKALLATVDVDVISHVVRIGSAVSDTDALPVPADLAAIDASPVRCFDADGEKRMVAAIEEAKERQESLGGIFEVLTYGLPAGLGSHVHWDRKLDGRLAQAICSIQAVKGVELGDAFAQAAAFGSDAHDEIVWDDEHGYGRTTHRAGGLEGGMTNGDVLVARGVMKPISTLPKPLRTVDVDTKEAAAAFRERTDAVAVPAAGVVGETMVALVLADAVLEQFGGDRAEDVAERVAAYRSRVNGR
jgi:chorismate synthase